MVFAERDGGVGFVKEVALKMLAPLYTCSNPVEHQRAAWEPGLLHRGVQWHGAVHQVELSFQGSVLARSWGHPELPYVTGRFVVGIPAG